LPSTWILNKKPYVRFPERPAECPLVITVKIPTCIY
jgi:hypothetical protein